MKALNLNSIWQKGFVFGIRAFILVIMMAALTSCINIPRGNKKDVRTYNLSSIQVNPSAIHNKTVLIEQIESNAILKSERIILTKIPYAYDYFADAEWGQPAPSMIYYLLKESFETTKALQTVNYDDFSLSPNYLLKIQLRDFQAEYHDRKLNDPPLINIKLYVSLIEMPGRRVKLSKTFEVMKYADENSMFEVIETFDECLKQIQKEIIEWTIQNI